MNAARDSAAVTLTKGSREELVSLFEMFDKLVPTKNYTMPPLED